MVGDKGKIHIELQVKTHGAVIGSSELAPNKRLMINIGSLK